MTNSTQTSDSQSLTTQLFLYGMAIGLALGIILVVAGGLFLTTFESDRLPYAVCMGGGVMIAVTWLYDELTKRIAFQTLQLGAWMVGVVVITAALLGLLQDESHTLVGFLLVIFLGMISLSDALNRQLIGHLGTLLPHYQPANPLEVGQVMGTGLGCMLALFMSEQFSLVSGLWLASISLASGFIVTFLLQKALAVFDDQDILPQTAIKAPSTTRARRSDMLNQPYFRSMVQSLALAVWLNPLTLVILLERLQGEWGNDRTQIVLTLAVLWAGIQIGHLFLRYAVFQPLLSRSGLRFILLFSPLATFLMSGGGFIMSLIGTSFAPALGLKFTEEITYQAVHRPSLGVLSHPLKQTYRDALKNRIDPWSEPLAVLLTGVILSLLSVAGLYQIETLMGFSAVLSAAWVYVIFQLYRDYSQTLDQAVRRRNITGEVILQNDGTTIGVLKNKLKSPHIGEVIYALDLLYQMEGPTASRYLGDLLTHPAPEVRREALLRIERHHQHVDPKLVAIVIEADDEPLVREIALRVYASLAGVADVENKLLPYLDDSKPTIQRGALIGLLNFGGQKGMETAEKHLLQLTQSSVVTDREFAAYVLGEVKNERFSSYVISLLNDRHASVQREAILAAGRLNSNKYWSSIVPQLGSREVGSAAATALFMANISVYPMLESVFNQPQPNPNLMIGIARVCGRRRDVQALNLLKSQFRYPDQYVRRQVWVSLSQCRYVAQNERERAMVESTIREEASEAAWIFAAQVDLGSDERFEPLLSAFEKELAQIRHNLLLLLEFIYPEDNLKNIRYNLLLTSTSRHEAVLDALQNLLSPALRSAIMPILRTLSPEQRLSQLKNDFPQSSLSPDKRLLAILKTPSHFFNTWIRALALYLLPQVAPPESTATILPFLDSLNSLIRETTVWALYQLDSEHFIQYVAPQVEESKPQAAALAHQIMQTGEVPMLLTIEKVLILKSVGIFSRVSDNILVEVAALLEERDLSAGEILFHQGDAGTAMFIIVNGKIRIYTENKVVAERNDRDFIGEMSLFDDEPRSASAQAIVDSKLLVLYQEAFEELMANHPEISIGIIRVLSTRLREAMQQTGVSPIMLDIFERLADEAEAEKIS